MRDLPPTGTELTPLQYSASKVARLLELNQDKILQPCPNLKFITKSLGVTVDCLMGSGVFEIVLLKATLLKVTLLHRSF